MFSKVLLFILISCTLTLASPANRNDESSNEVAYPTNEEVKEAVEIVLLKVSQAVKELLEALTKQIEQGLNSENLIHSVKQLTELLKKAFNTNESEQSISEQEIQNAVNEAIKNACEVFKGIFEAFFEKVEDKFNDEELKKSIKHLNTILEKIFTYDNTDKEQRSRYLPTSDELDVLTQGELEKVGRSLRGLFKDIFVRMLENPSNEIVSSEKSVVESILNEMLSEQVHGMTN